MSTKDTIRVLERLRRWLHRQERIARECEDDSTMSTRRSYIHGERVAYNRVWNVVRGEIAKLKEGK